jgi:hypothetical protein
MSRAALERHVWEHLGPQKFAAGRVRVSRITKRVIRRWNYTPDADAIAANVELDERHDTQMGVILSFVLSALIAEIVRLIAAWWRDSHANRCLLMGYQRELPDE